MAKVALPVTLTRHMSQLSRGSNAMQELNAQEVEIVSGAGIFKAVEGLIFGLESGTLEGAQIGKGALGSAVGSITVGIGAGVQGFFRGLFGGWW
ncbi:hypothetical protein [Pseudomonas sp. B329]|uniref:hypothetical protein n=1 Tax=Pseudomonas sp. B329 TaxID=1553459 RepID=UPI0020055B5F|nr:hypothetical protein [Pseudomonas sp. B329]MCK3863819.1 hypothetical protein [Pseudomonas sp. B329]